MKLYPLHAKQAQRGCRRVPIPTQVLEGGGGGCQHHTPTALPPGKKFGTPCVGGWEGFGTPSGWIRKIFPPPGMELRTVPRVAGRYTNCAISADFFSKTSVNIDASTLYDMKKYLWWALSWM